MGSFSHAFVPLPTILPTGGYQKWPGGKPQRWGPHEWPRSSRGHVRKTELLLSVIKRKRKTNKPTKKKILGGPLMYRLKNNNKTKQQKKICYLSTSYIRCTSISQLIPHLKKNHKNFIMHSKKIKEKKIKYCTIKRIHFIMDNLIKRKNA
jgi:hypothetical protein